MIKPKEIREHLAECNAEAILYDGCDDALVGVGERCGQPSVAIYSYEQLVSVFEKQFGDYTAAVEWVDFNICGGWLGEHTPMILFTPTSDDE